MSKLDFLKRYMTDEKDGKKSNKRKIKKVAVKKRLKVFDDDIDVRNLPTGDSDEYPEFGEDAPLVVQVVDNGRDEEKIKELFSDRSRWKTLSGNEDNKGKHTHKDAVKHQHHESDSDNSPPRKSNLQHRLDSDSDLSPRRNVRHDSDSDLSPPRSRTDNKHGSKSNKMPFKKQIARHDSDSDLSPPRNHKDNKHQSKKSSLKSQRSRHDSSDSDLSPQRIKTERRDSNSDLSPPRIREERTKSKKSKHRVPSPRKTNDSDSDPSPPRKHFKQNKKDSDSDLSPPRNSRQRVKEEKSDRSRTAKSDDPRLKYTLDGKRAGLQNARALKEENDEARERENYAFSKLSDEVSGRNAETVLRDRKTGRKRNIVQEQIIDAEKAAKEEARKEKYMQWGKGMKQDEMQKKRFESDMHEMSKPIARYIDDQDLDKDLREREREGDPMLMLIKKKKSKDVPKDSVPKYSGPFPPNRFNIVPGYRWDGVDRSNGFEKSRLARVANRVADEEEAFKWSVEDM